MEESILGVNGGEGRGGGLPWRVRILQREEFLAVATGSSHLVRVGRVVARGTVAGEFGINTSG